MAFRAVVRAAVAGVLIAWTVAAAATASISSPLLKAHNTITVDGYGTVDVILPRDIRLPLAMSTRSSDGPAPWITFEGDGRAVGIALIPRGSNDAISSGLVATQFRSCRRACRERAVNALMVNGAVYHGSETLRAGDYRLYAFTDGERATIRLDLAQLTGSTNIHVADHGHADIRTPAVHVERRDGATAYSAGASYEMRDRAGLFMSVNVMRDDEYSGTWFDECLSAERETPNEVEQIRCFPSGFTGIHPDFRRTILPREGGFILITFVALNDSADDAINGDSSFQHYNFRAISPGPIAELWSQGLLLTL